MSSQSIPARSRSTVTREVAGEYVVIDETTDQAHCLDGLSADVWRAAGTTADVDPAAVDALIELGLLDAPGMSRRSVLQRTGIVAAGVGIASMALPAASAAASVARIASITPTSGPKGTVVTLSGSGYGANKLIQVTVDGFSAVVTDSVGGGAGTITTDASGNIPTGTKFTIPDTGTNTGPQPVAVLVTGSPSTSAGNFNITVPTITMSKTTTFNKNQSGQTFTLSGTGWGPNSVVGFTAPSGWTRSPTSVTASAVGVISPTTITVGTPPGNSNGSFVYTDQYGNTVSVLVSAS